MLPLVLALAAAQVPEGFSPPPLVQVEDAAPPVPAPALTPPPLLRFDDTALRGAFLKELELTRQLSAVTLQIAELDVSGPGWAVPMRGLGYALIVPAFLFIAPVMSGNSVAVGTASLIDTTQTLTPTLNLVGVTLTVVASIALGIGIGAGVVGWMLKRWELDALRSQKASLERQLEAHRTTSIR